MCAREGGVGIANGGAGKARAGTRTNHYFIAPALLSPPDFENACFSSQRGSGTLLRILMQISVSRHDQRN